MQIKESSNGWGQCPFARPRSRYGGSGLKKAQFDQYDFLKKKLIAWELDKIHENYSSPFLLKK
jgi:hypothetical protein